MDNYGNSTSVAAAQASDQAQRTADAAYEALQGAKRTAQSAMDAGRGYAADAAKAAGIKVDEAREHVERLTNQTSHYVKEQPLRAIGIAAAAGFLTAVLINGLRSR